MAGVIDGLDQAERPYIADDHPRVDDAEREAFVRYLEAGKIVLHARMRRADILTPGSTGRVPVYFATDGEYVWPGEVVYYLKTYGLSPDAEFLRYLRERAPHPPDAVDEASVQAALDLISSGDPA